VYTAAFNAPLPAIAVAGGSAVAGRPVTLSAAGSTAGAGHTLQSWQWSLVDDGGIVSGLSGNASSVTVTPSAAGQFSVRLIVTDEAGTQGVREQTITVAGSAPPPSDDGGGGGAVSAAWLAGLAAAVLALSRPPRRRPRKA
jgi:serine protease